MNQRVVRQVYGEKPGEGVRIEYIGSSHMGGADLGLSEARVRALVHELLGENDFLPEDSSPAGPVLELLDQNGMRATALEVGKRVIRLEVESDAPPFRAGGARELEKALLSAVPGTFFEITLRELESSGAQAENASGRYQLHAPHIRSSSLGVGEMEHFRRFLESVIQEGMPTTRVEVLSGELVIKARTRAEGEWVKQFLPPKLGYSPVPISLIETVETEEASDIPSRLESDELRRLVQFALQRGQNANWNGEVLEIENTSGEPLPLKQIRQTLKELYGIEPRIRVCHPSQEWEVCRKTLSPELLYRLSHLVDSKGQVLSPISGKSAKFDGHGSSFVTTWELPLRASEKPIIAVDPKESSSDVAFGVKKARSGGWIIEACILNVARINPIGGENDEATAQRARSSDFLNLYPKAVRERYLGLSTKFERPLLQVKIALTAEGEIDAIDLRECRGTIDFRVTPEEFQRGGIPRIQDQVRLTKELEEILRERGHKRERLSFNGIYDSLQELHLLLYEALGNWCSKHPGVAFPYRASPNPVGQYDPEVANFIAIRTSPDQAKRFRTPRLRRAVLREVLKSISDAESAELLRLLRPRASYTTAPHHPHHLLGIEHYLRCGGAIVDDLGRVAQHQILAALGVFLPLSASEVNRRITLYDKSVRAARNGGRGIEYLKTIEERSATIGRIVNIDNGPNEERSAIKVNGLPVELPGAGHIPTSHVRIIGYSVPRESYVGRWENNP